MLNDFVKRYKVSLTMRQAHPLTMRLSFLLRTLGMVSLWLGVGLLVGALSGTLSSFNYLFLWMQVTFTVTLLVMIHRKATGMAKAADAPTVVRDVLFVEGSYGLARWYLSTVLVYALFFPVVGHVLVLILLLVLSLLTSGVWLAMSWKEDRRLMRETVVLAGVLTLIHLALLVLMPIRSLTLNYLVSATVMAIMVLTLENAHQPLYGETVKMRRYVRFALPALLVIVALFGLSGRVRLMTWFATELNVAERIVLEHHSVNNPHIRRSESLIYPDGERILMIEYEVIESTARRSFVQVYDRSGNHIKMVEFPELGPTVVLSNTGLYIQVNRHPECFLLEPCDVEDISLRAHHLYRLDESHNFELIVVEALIGPISYVVEEGDTIRLFTGDHIGVYDRVTQSLNWQSLDALAPFRYQDAVRYFWLEANGKVHTNMMPPSSQVNQPRALPFFTGSVLGYHDGYVVGYKGDPNDLDIWLLDLYEETALAVPNLPFVPFVFWVDQHRLITMTSGTLGFQRPTMTSIPIPGARPIELPYDFRLNFSLTREGVFTVLMDDERTIMARLAPEQRITIVMRQEKLGVLIDEPVALIGLLAGFVYPALLKKRWSQVMGENA
ncbi:MAG: hypothetical protein EA374_03715 [Acholeplasmatales bacterium]|nr:MAG: hypothetical protein EA374_03715 [Acholeplasmatales bacterium]